MTDQSIIAPATKQPGRRNFLKLGALALAGATLIPGGLPRAFAQSTGGNTDTSSPVNSQFAKSLFRDMTLYTTDVMSQNFHNYYRQTWSYTIQGDMAAWQREAPMILKDFDAEGFLRSKYQNATNDEQRATILAFEQLGGIGLAKEAAAQAFSKADKPDLYPDKGTSILDGAKPYVSNRNQPIYYENIGMFNDTVNEFANKNVQYGEKRVPFNDAVVIEASGWLAAAHKKPQRGFTEYLTQSLIPYKTNDPGAISAQKAARSLVAGLDTRQTVAIAPIRQP